MGKWRGKKKGLQPAMTRLGGFTFTFTFMHWRRKWQPTQCSCLENPGDGGAWWAAVSGVTESDRTEATVHESSGETQPKSQ